jgi:ADP-ribose pyrophosphatase YjhB (NUDIX family)
MVKRAAYLFVSRFFLHPWFRLTRGITLGARIAVVNGDGEIYLVRHTYAPGWFMPGGGVESGETAAAAAVRELREEGNIAPAGPFRLHGIFLNEANFKGDHIACFILRDFVRGDWSPDAEIAEARFFPLTSLPPDISPGTRRRIAEIFEGAPVEDQW